MSSDLSLLQGDGLTNQGVISGYGIVASPLTNETDGQVRGETNQRLVFTGAGNANAGEISLGGGTDIAPTPGRSVHSGV